MHTDTGMLEFNCAQILLVYIARAALHALPVHIMLMFAYSCTSRNIMRARRGAGRVVGGGANGAS